MTIVTRLHEGSNLGLTGVALEFRTVSMLKTFCGLLMSLLVSGHAVWWLEKRRNSKQFHESYLDGVDDGIWWSFVTMTTGKYFSQNSDSFHLYVSLSGLLPPPPPPPHPHPHPRRDQPGFCLLASLTFRVLALCSGVRRQGACHNPRQSDRMPVDDNRSHSLRCLQRGHRKGDELHHPSPENLWAIGRAVA